MVVALHGLLPITSSAVAQTVAESPPRVDPIATHIAEASQRFGVPEAWIYAVMGVESAGDLDATSVKGAMGLMQVMPGTYADLRARYGLGPNAYDPRDNILAGTAYLREMYDRYGSPGFLAAYNAGPGRYEAHLAGPPLPLETRAYLARLSPAVGGVVTARSITAPDPLAWTRATLFAGRWSAGEPAVEAASGPPSDALPSTQVVQLARPTNGLFVPLSGDRR
ncbi:lytic transglycosylase domain-containing protein [Sphingomonas sp. DOAB1063]|uniref:Lytic transglycosylase domain-containing protein n=2 Tax=Sphingomonas albertensis TaxID=2762591 RepID=A0ABR7AL01_9SPHN|nr:lytic transglycosylase domain-containing protein [Sphingomonas albertensis]